MSDLKITSELEEEVVVSRFGPRIFLDLDGVVADFDSKFKKLFGKTSEVAENDRSLWPLMHGHQDFYLDLDLMEDAPVLLEYLHSLPHELVVLTAIPRRASMPLCEEHKRIWVKEKLGDLPVRIGPHSRDKYKHCERPLDILIDDRLSNIEEWSNAGGIAIHHTNADRTIRILKGIL